MATIAENLQIIKDSTDAIRQAILNKGGEITGDISTWANTISNLASGSGGTLSSSDVNFYDYDGILLHTYTKDEFLALTSLPELPTQHGLICQGWNWTLEDAKAYVQEYGKLDVGATYITDDNKTRLYINLLNNGLSIPLCINLTVDNGVTVEWGDGNTETMAGTGKVTFNHTYNEVGSYTISLIVNSGTCNLGHSSSSYNVMGAKNTIATGSLYKVEIGSNMSIGNYTFNNCYSLQSITIPNSVTSIGGLTFGYCYSLQSITIPNSVTSINAGNTFQYCYSLQSITIPNSVTSIGVGNIFQNCYNLQNITIPDSITAISDRTFANCYSLQSITIPNSVTSISAYIFQNCYSMQYYDFTSHTSVPTLANVNAFAGISSDCEIRVPAALYEEWKAATNWSNYADYIVPYEG